jgi:hypothetical protein
MVWQAAIVRSIYGGVLNGLAVGIGVYTTTNSIRAALLAGGAVSVGYLITRGVAEGLIDNYKTPTLPNPPAASR